MSSLRYCRTCNCVSKRVCGKCCTLKAKQARTREILKSLKGMLPSKEEEQLEREIFEWQSKEGIQFCINLIENKYDRL